MDDRLLPCPFCGNAPNVVVNGIHCVTCEITLTYAQWKHRPKVARFFEREAGYRTEYTIAIDDAYCMMTLYDTEVPLFDVPRLLDDAMRNIVLAQQYKMLKDGVEIDLQTYFKKELTSG